MEKLKLQSPLLSIVKKINELIEIVSNDTEVVKSFKSNSSFKQDFKLEEINRKIFAISVTGAYKISTNTRGTIFIKINKTGINDRSYRLDKDKQEINNLVLYSGDKLYVVSEDANADDTLIIELTSNIVKYLYDTKIELEKAINLYRPMQYGEFTKEQINSLKGEPFRYSDFTESQLKELTGKSAYEVWLSQGYVGSERDFLDSLHGRDRMISFDDLTEEEKKQIMPPPITLNDMTKEEVADLVSQVGDYTKDRLLQINEIPIMAIEEPLIALSHLSDPGKDLVDKEGKLYRGDIEVGVRVKNSGTTYTIPETVQKARIFFKAQCEDPTLDNWIFWWIGDGTDENKRYVSELENRTRHYSTVVDLSESHEIVISTVQAWDKTVKIWDFDWKEVL